MEQIKLAELTVWALSADNSFRKSWVESGGETFAFRSEMQSLKWLCKKQPRRVPEIGNGFSKG